MAIDDNIIVRQQVRGTAELIAEYPGAPGQIVFNTTDGNMHVMTGTAGDNGIFLCKPNTLSEIESACNSLAETINASIAELEVAVNSDFLTKEEASAAYATIESSEENLTEEEADEIYWRKDEQVDSASSADKLTSPVAITLQSGAIGSGIFTGDADCAITVSSILGSSVTGTVAEATKATQDGDGNVISSTYRKTSVKITLSDLDITDFGMVGE